jgi:hypothetical protein
VHRLPLQGPGLYLFFPVVLFWAARRSVQLSKTRVRERRARLGLLAFALFQILYVSSTSALFTIGESARYRYQIEAQIWLLTLAALVAAWRSLRPRRSEVRSRSAIASSSA